MNLQGIHHVAYRCKDAKQTVAFYRDIMGLDFQIAVAADELPPAGGQRGGGARVPQPHGRGQRGRRRRRVAAARGARRARRPALP